MQCGDSPLNVIFDLGNVVLDWDPQKIVRAVDAPAHQQQAIKAALFEHQDWLDLDCGLLTEAEVVPRVSARATVPTALVEQALAATKQSLTPIARSLDLLRKIDKAGFPLYCLSNMSVETYSYLEARMDFFDHFEGIVISGVEKHMKPDPRIFELLLDRHGLQAERSFFIDDSPPNIETAKGLGLHTHEFRRTDDCYSRIQNLLL